MRVERYDLALTLELVDSLDGRVPVPGQAAAVITPEGYLEADALTARDGRLVYSDGQRSWVEYRPRSELVAALDSFRGAPVTDGHPERMVTVETIGDVYRGHAIGIPTLVEQDGTAYIRDRLRISDADLIAKVKSGEAAQISIGFTAEVHPTRDGRADDGTECAAVQRGLLGNHNAVVPRGRAGPACRVLDSHEVPRLDVAATCDYSETAVTRRASPETHHMTTKAETKAKTDAVGAPTDMAPVISPTGEELMLPTWVVAQLEELAMLKGQAPAPAAPPAPPAPELDAGTMPPAPAAAPEEERRESVDSIEKRMRRRARLERLATKVGIEDAVIDACDDADELARLYVAQRLPWAEESSKTLRGDALDALVLVAAKRPEPEPEPETAPDPVPDPWGLRRVDARVDADLTTDPIYQALEASRS